MTSCSRFPSTVTSEPNDLLRCLIVLLVFVCTLENEHLLHQRSNLQSAQCLHKILSKMNLRQKHEYIDWDFVPLCEAEYFQRVSELCLECRSLFDRL